LNDDSRRAHLTCPVSTVLNPTVRFTYEPHGAKRHTGQQNNRLIAITGDPEAKNYLFTDGSVIYVKH
jgi:prepilin-type processing-associated H-X9-DG protein